MTPHPTVLVDADDRRLALTEFSKNLVVVAGAGTGKTSLLVGRLAYALVRLKYEPSQLLALTFTDNAAAEMRGRLVRLLRAARTALEGGDVADASDRHTLDALGFGPEDRSRIEDILTRVDALPLSTFHSFCARLLGQHARALGLPPELRAGDMEASRASYDAAFLEFLAAQSPDAIPKALEEFEPKALHDFGWELRKLPLDAVARCTDLPNTFEGGDEEIETLLAEVREALTDERLIDQYRDHFELCEQALSALLARDVAAIPKRLARPGGGYKQPWRTRKDPEKKKRVQDLANRLHDSLKPWILADTDAIRAAIEFVQPFLDRFRRDAEHRGELTFDDVILQTRHHLMESAELRRAAGGRLRAVLVDEFQDTDPLLYDVLFLLCAEPCAGRVERPFDLAIRSGTLFIVGDPKQSIYRFRDADLAAFDAAASKICDAAGGRRLSLRTNFRCAPPIVTFVNHTCSTLLDPDPPYQLGYEPIVAHRGDHPNARVEWVTVEGTGEAKARERRLLEGRAVVDSILEFHEQGFAFSDIAVLLRAATETNWLLRPLRESRIPYAMEGSRRFYQRHEIVVATALLGALARPHDPVPVLGVLRSAFSAATDRDILEHVRAHGRHALDYRETDGADGQVSATLAWLRELRGRLTSLPIDRALDEVLSLEAWTLTEGSGYEGAQRLANLDRMRQRLADARPLDLTAAADFAEQRTNREVDDEESPLFDADFDAVRLLTIHASKGLEYGVVLLPDLAREVKTHELDGQEPKVQRGFLKNRSEVVGARLGGLRNVASWVLKQENQRHGSAEADRLFYVAATRAKHALRLICSETAAKSSTQSRIEAATLPESTVRRSLDPTTARTSIEATAPADTAATLDAWRAHERAIAALGPRTPEPIPEAGDDDVPTFSGTRPDAAFDARDLGTAIHRYLSIVDFRSTELDRTLLDSVLENGAFADDLLDMATAFHRSELAARMRRAHAVHRELPITFLDDDDVPQFRVLDLLLVESEADDPELRTYTIVDHKSDHVPEGGHAEAAARHEEQLARYAEGLRNALGANLQPICLIHFTRDARLVPVTPPPLPR